MMSIYSGVCRIYTPRHSAHFRYPCISVQWPALLEDEIDRACLRWTWRRRSNELRDALGGRKWENWEDAIGGRHRSSLEMYLDAKVELTQWCTLRARSREFGDALGGRDRVNSEDALGGRDHPSLEIHSGALTERVWRHTCRLWSSEIGGVLGGGRFGGRRDGSWDSIHWLTCNWMRNWLGAGDCRSWDDLVVGVCCTLC